MAGRVRALLQSPDLVCSGCRLLTRRQLNLHEFQSKTLMREFKLRVQPFRVAENKQQARAIPEEFKCREYVVKAQILAGGRGKGHFVENGFKGGVKLTEDPAQVADYVEKMLGNRLVTHQTLKDGVKVNKVMIAESYNIVTETYFAILMDREFGGPVLVGSSKGGVDIEQVAATDPDSIFKIPVDIVQGLTTDIAREAAEKLGMTGPQVDDAADQIKKLYSLFLNIDATQVEINPLGVTDTGKVVMFDAKINFDDNAEFRQKEIFGMEDKAESDVREVAAESAKLNYIGMDGNIACVVNGAGLAMATMDIIKLHGGEPANFLDVGGTVTEPQVLEAFKILTSDSKVKTIFVNIFAGIVNCVTIANGLIAAANTLKLEVPLVVRLAGNNADKAAEILSNSGLNIISADELDTAAKKAVESALAA